MAWNSRKTARWAVLMAFAAASSAAQEVPAPSPSPPAALPPPRGIEDQRRTVRSYPANLLYNFMGVLTPGNYPILAAGVVLTAPCFALDDDVDDYFTRHPHDNWGDIGKTVG